jgi:phosphopantothenoylcysteine decarboxylase / phosphopantothenate---cysteine ligase
MNGKRILVGITGGIAAYKSAELVRRLVERGAEVQVVMTAGAKRFITPLTLQAVSGRPVRDDLWDEAAEAAMGHIELARWADQVIVAPASADFIARLVHGNADDLLTTLCLATDAPIGLAPAMNRLMWSNAATQANVAILVERGVRVLGPGEGAQACGETGPGRMLEPDDILSALNSDGVMAGRTVLVTAGPTREPIDPVRFISNRSSGKMGYAVAAAARDAGARVILVSGPTALEPPKGVDFVRVETAADMHAAVMERVGDAGVFIATAAVADWTPGNSADSKVKKESGAPQLSLEHTADILTEVAALAMRPYTVGFAAETDEVEAHARAKLERKKLDLIAANRVGEGMGFDVDDNELKVFWAGGEAHIGPAPKTQVARELVAVIAARVQEK